MGGQACVFYGAAQVSKDIDLLLLADDRNFDRLHRALATLEAKRIAVPRFDPKILARGHAVHFRCQAAGVEGLRIDIMTKLRGVPEFDYLWERRTVIGDLHGEEFHLLSVPDLVSAKKTQRTKDWPMIEALVSIHYRENAESPSPEWVRFWLLECRSAELLLDLTTRFPAETATLQQNRPLLRHAIASDLPALREALDAEVRAEKEKDRIYWEPLKRELTEFRRAERDGIS